ncbi:MAG: hypothetical protein ACOYL3_25510 [Desulfuromonadaceae bacterium]
MKNNLFIKHHKVSYALIVSAFLLILPVTVCSAASGKKKLLLFAKNPATWTIIKGGGNGKLVYREATGMFTLTAAGLPPRSSYTLVRYADTPPQIDILATKESDTRGNLEVSGVWHNWSKKFWLVPTEDVKGPVGSVGSLTAWRPDRYLFEEKPLGIACLCPEPEEPD